MSSLRLDGRRAALLVSSLAVLCAAAPAKARDLTEILSEKGLITPAESAEAQATKTNPTITYKEGLGFVFATPDDRFSLAVGGYFQFRYQLTDIDDRFQSTAKGSSYSQTFDVPRARLWWRFRKRLRGTWTAPGSSPRAIAW